MNIGEKLQYYRKKAGLSQEELGQKLFVSRQTVSQWEMNKTLPTIDNLMLLKTIYGIPVDDFLSGDDPTENHVENRKEEPTEKYDYVYSKSELHDFNKRYVISKVLNAIVLLIVMSALLIISAVTNGGNTAIAAFTLILIFVAVFYAKVLFQSTKASRKNIAFMSVRRYTFEVFDKYFILSITKDGTLIKWTRVDYRNIDTVKMTGNFLTVSAEGYLYLFKKDTLAIDSVLYSIYNKHTEDKPLDSRYTILSKMLFVISILSFFCALVCVSISKGSDKDITECMWIFFLFTPIPIGSTVFGLWLKSKGYKYKKNVIAGIIMTVILCIYGSFSFIFNDLYTHSDVPVIQAEEQTGIDIPEYKKINTQDLTKGTQSVSRGYVFSISDVYFGKEEAKSFEYQIAHDIKWLSAIPSDLIGITSDFTHLYSFDYCSVYNIETGEFNTLPGNPDTYRFYNFLYNSQNGCLRIIEYEIEYIKQSDTIDSSGSEAKRPFNSICLSGTL